MLRKELKVTLHQGPSVISTKPTYLFEFLDLGLLKHGEDVGISTFNPLLGFLGCLQGFKYVSLTHWLFMVWNKSMKLPYS